MTHSMHFDFEPADQRSILAQLQIQDFRLLGYMGVGEASQTAGVPVWFSLPFSYMFGQSQIIFEPQYKIYISHQAHVTANMHLSMDAISDVVPQGSALTFEPDSRFVAGGVTGVPSASFGLRNNSSNTLTVGLAALANPSEASGFLPFCAFTLTPGNSILMTPSGKVLLVISANQLRPGDVQLSIDTLGGVLTFPNGWSQHNLRITTNPFAVVQQRGHWELPVLPVSPGTNISTAIA